MSRRLRNMMLSGDGRGGGAVGVQETVNSAITSGGGGGGGGDATSAASDYSSASAIATTASWLSRFLGQHSVFLNLLALSLLLLLSRHTKRRRAPPPSAAHNRHPRRATSSISPRRISRTLHHEDLPPPPPSPETLISAGAARSPQQRETHTEAEFGSLPLQSPETLISSGDIVEGAARSPRQRSAMAMAREIHRTAEVGALPPPQEAKTLNLSDGEPPKSSTQSVETLNFSGGEPPTSSSTQSVETLNFSSGGPTSSSTQTVETLNFSGGEPSSSSTQSVETLNFSDGEPPTYSSTQSVETLNVSDGERPKSSTQSVETLISRSPRQRTMAKSKEARIQEIRGSPGGRYSETLISGEAGSPKAIATENSKQKLIMSRTDQNGGRKMKNSATLLQASRSLVVTREGEGGGGGGRVRVTEAVMRGEKIEEIWRQISAGKAESVKVLHGRISRLDADMALDGPDFKKRVDRFIYKMKRNIIMEARRDAAADNLITAT